MGQSKLSWHKVLVTTRVIMCKKVILTCGYDAFKVTKTGQNGAKRVKTGVQWVTVVEVGSKRDNEGQGRKKVPENGLLPTLSGLASDGGRPRYSARVMRVRTPPHMGQNLSRFAHMVQNGCPTGTISKLNYPGWVTPQKIRATP